MIKIPHANRGRPLEQLVIDTLPDWICLDKTRAGVRTLKGGRIIGCAGPPDFLGTIQGGRSICFDCKQTSEKYSFPVAVVPAHQRRWLVRNGRMGAVAGLLIEATAEGRLYWMGWKLLEGMGDRWEWKQLVEVGQGAIDWSLIVESSGAPLSTSDGK